MKVNKIFIVSLLLLAILTLGAASAADDTAVDDLAVEDAGDLDLEVPAADEITTDGGITEDVAVGDSSDDILGETQEEELSAGSVTPSCEWNINLTKSGQTYYCQWGQPIVVSANYGDATGNATITFDGKTYTAYLVDGAFSYEITNYSSTGRKELTVKYNGDDKYATHTFSNNRINIQLNDITVSSSTVYFGQKNAHMNVNLHDATGVVNFTVAGITYSKLLENGITSFEVTKYDEGWNTITVAYGGDEKYNGFTTTKSVNFKYDIGLSTERVNFGQNSVNVNVNLYDATGIVTFTNNGHTYSRTLQGGVANIELTKYALGSDTVTVTYGGDGTHGAFSRNLSFTTTATIDADTIYELQPAIINVNLYKATGNVTFSLGNDTKNVGLVDGLATFETTDYTVGVNEVSINYTGDDSYDAFSTTKDLTVLGKENVKILSSVYKTANNTFVCISIPGINDNISLAINGKKEVVELVDSVIIKTFNASEEIREINVTYAGDDKHNSASSSDFLILDCVVNNDTYMYYFNQADYGKLFEFIEPGSTLDFQGSIINNDQSINVLMNVNIPVNIVSTTGDALIDLNASGYNYALDARANSFAVSYYGSGSNITGISFHNTPLFIRNTTHVVLDKINVVNTQKVSPSKSDASFYVGYNASYITVKNSYFYEANNENSNMLFIIWATNCTFDNNTFVQGEGMRCILYLLSTAGLPSVPVAAPTNPNSDINFTNNVIRGEGDIVASVTIGSPFYHSIICNNYIGAKYGSNDVLGVGQYSVAYNNTVLGSITIRRNSEVYNNTVGGLTLSGSNEALVYDNVINGTTTIDGAPDAQIYNNTFIGDYTIKFNNANAKNILFTGNDVRGNIQFTKNAKNNNIINNTIITSGDYAIDLQTFTGTGNNISDNVLYSAKGFGNNAVNHVDDTTLTVENNHPSLPAEIVVVTKDINVGETAVINIKSNETAIAIVEVSVNGERYTVNLTKGKGTLELGDLLSGEYDVSVMSRDLTYGAQNATSFNVTKNSPTILVDAPVKTQWIDSNITVTINDATGNVTLDINGTELISEFVDGVAVFEVPDLVFGEYNYTITYLGDFRYFGNATNGTLTVNRNKEVKIIASDIVEYKLVDKFVAKFTDYIGEGIANANVTIKIGDAAYPLVTDENGTTIADLALTRGKYSVSVEFKAIEGEYDAATAEYNIVVIDASVIRIISVDEEGLVTGSLGDALNVPIANATIVATMNGTGVNLTTNNTGLFLFQAEDGCKVTFEYAGDDITTGSDASITVNIKPTPKDTSIISIVSVDGTGLITGSLTVLGSPISNVIVVATMNGTNVSLITDDDGLFEFQVINGFETVFKYSGDFNKTDANASITLNNIAPIPKDTSVIKVVSVDGDGVIVGSLSVDGVGVANATVVASVNGVDVNLTTDDSGLFEFQAVNGFETVFKYVGDDTTAASDVAITLNNVAPIPKDTSVIKVVSVDGSGVIVGSLSVDGVGVANASVVASVNGVDVNLTTDDSGLFEFQAVNGFETVFKYAGDNVTAASDVAITLNNVASIPKNTSVIDLMSVDGNGLITGKLIDNAGAPIVNALLSYTVNGNVSNTTTDDSGAFTINASSNAVVDIKYDGNDQILPANTTITLKDLDPAKVATQVLGNNFTQYTVEFSAGERGGNFTVQLVDANGAPLANKTVYIGYNGKTLEFTTDENGNISKSISLKNENILTFAVVFLGDEQYNSSMSVYAINIIKKPVTMTASAKSYKASAKTKKYTVTLKTIKGSSADGKTYFAAGKKVTLTINGKTYTAKTNSKGQATFSLKITKKGKFTTSIKYAGDKTYESISKSVKITIK